MSIVSSLTDSDSEDVLQSRPPAPANPPPNDEEFRPPPPARPPLPPSRPPPPPGPPPPSHAEASHDDLHDDDHGFSASVNVQYEVVHESPVLVPLSSSAPDAAAFSRLEVGGAAADAAASLLESPPSKEFHLEGVRSREAHRLRAVEDDRAVELKISQAVRKRIDTAQLTCRELLKVFQTRRASDLAVKSSCSDLLALVTDESATLSPALTAIKNQFAAIAAIYEESSQSIETEGVNRASSMSESFTAQVHKARNEVGSHVPELQAARALAKQTYSKQEKAMTVAFNPQGTIVVNDPALALQLAGNPELDPWLATVAHEAAVKGVETLGAKQQGAFQNGVTDLLEADNRRLEATKSLLLTFLQNEKKKLQAHLDAVDSLFDCVQDINPSTDANSFLSSFNISEADLSRNKKEAKSEGGSQPPDMGVWIPDESVKVCTQCTASFSLFKRKHHCRYCGRVFCADCTPHNVMLPVQFGYSDPQRVCQSCVPAIEAAKESFNADQVLLGESCKTEVVKQAWLNKRGHMMKGYRQKRRYFVLTRCGYLHFFPNKWSAEPLASIWLQPCSVLIDPKENCGFKVQVQAMKGSRKKVFDDSELVLQCESEAERDDWIRLLKTFATGP